MTSDENIIRCPSCGARDVRNSMKHGIWDRIRSAFGGRTPMRCRQCQKRFFVRRRKGQDEGQPDLKESKQD